MGLLLVGVVISWTLLAVVSMGGSPGAFIALVLSCASALVGGRLVASARWWLVPAAVVFCGALLFVVTPDVLSGTPLGGPLGYANANGAFFVQAAIAGLILATGARTTAVTLLGLVSAIAFGVVPFAAKSVTSAALLLLLPGIALSVHSLGPRVAVAVFAALFITALTITIALGSTYEAGDRSGSVERVVDATIDERRAALWHEALVMMNGHPAIGVGLGEFQVLSPTARLDRDARWAHNSFLQQGAETGIVGFILLVLVFIWGFVSLRVTASDAVGVLGAVSLAALGIHACVDYILHFPAVPITAAALVGAAGTPRKVHGR